MKGLANLGKRDHAHGYGAEFLKILYKHVLPGRIRFRPLIVDRSRGADYEPLSLPVDAARRFRKTREGAEKRSICSCGRAAAILKATALCVKRRARVTPQEPSPSNLARWEEVTNRLPLPPRVKNRSYPQNWITQSRQHRSCTSEALANRRQSHYHLHHRVVQVTRRRKAQPLFLQRATAGPSKEYSRILRQRLRRLLLGK